MKSSLHWRSGVKKMTERKKSREMLRVTSQSTMEAEKEVVGREGDTKMAEWLPCSMLNTEQ